MKAGLRYVYCGNIPGEEGEDSLCPQCGRKVIERVGFQVIQDDVINGECRLCHTKNDGMWS